MPVVDAVRDQRVVRIRRALELAVESTTELRGSLAAGTADDLSDIDLAWHVGPRSEDALREVAGALGRVATLASLRIDPETLESPTSRLLFARFDGWSVFARLDLEVTGAFGSATPARWSAHESAVMNVIAAERAVRRGRGDVDGLLRRACERLRIPVGPGSPEDAARRVLRAAADGDPSLAEFVAEVEAEIARRPAR